LLLGFGAILLVLLAWLLSSSIHSKSAVDRYKDKLRAAGEKLDVKDLIPPRPDPDKNGLSLFESAALHMNSGAGALQSNGPPAMRMVAPGKAMVGWQQSEIVSVEYSSLITNTWNDIELALQSQGSTLDLLRQTAERPQLVFELDYKQGTFPPLTYLSAMKGAALLLSPAAIDALHRGDSAEAVTNIHCLLALVNGWKEPFYISQLVRVAMAQIAATGQWELLQATNLSDQQLTILQKDWTDLDFCRGLEKALLIERIYMNTTIQQLRTSNNPSAIYAGLYTLGTSSSSSGDWLEDLKDLGRSAKLKTAETLWRVSWSYSDELANLQGDQVTGRNNPASSDQRFFQRCIIRTRSQTRRVGAGSAKYELVAERTQ